MYVEEFPNGDGYWHMCDICGGSIGESDSLTVAGTRDDGDKVCHTSCFNDSF